MGTGRVAVYAVAARMPDRRPWLAALAVLAVLAAVALTLGPAGCDRRRGVGEPTSDAGAGPRAAASATGSTAPAMPAMPARSAARGDRDEGPSAPPPSGGPWATCADGFRISGSPLRDATRLGLLCGPATGLRRPEPPLEKTVSPNEPWAFDVPLAAGECLRLVVTSSTAGPLSVQTTGAPGVVSSIAGDAGWLLVRRGGPLCADQAGPVHVVVTSATGANVAVGRWFLPP